MKVKVKDLIDAPLDWAVATIEGYECQFDDEVSGPWLVPQEGFLHDEKPLSKFSPSTNWLQGGPIIEREAIGIMCLGKSAIYANPWLAARTEDDTEYAGPTALIALMRCFVASCLGDEVDIPEELLK